jgi:hypothetical protein
MTNYFEQIVTYEELGILGPFEGVYFCCALFKAFRYAIFKEKVSLSLQLVSIKSTKSSIQACITWLKI